MEHPGRSTECHAFCDMQQHHSLESACRISFRQHKLIRPILSQTQSTCLCLHLDSDVEGMLCHVWLIADELVKDTLCDTLPGCSIVTGIS